MVVWDPTIAGDLTIAGHGDAQCLRNIRFSQDDRSSRDNRQWHDTRSSRNTRPSQDARFQLDTRSLLRHLILDGRYVDRRLDTGYLRDIRSSQDTR